MSAQPGLHAQPVAQPQEHSDEWHSSLFDCFGNENPEQSSYLCPFPLIPESAMVLTVSRPEGNMLLLLHVRQDPGSHQ
jgi:hypothetical protein